MTPVGTSGPAATVPWLTMSAALRAPTTAAGCAPSSGEEIRSPLSSKRAISGGTNSVGSCESGRSGARSEANTTDHGTCVCTTQWMSSRTRISSVWIGYSMWRR